MESFIRDIDVPDKALEKIIGQFARVSKIIPRFSSFLCNLYHAFYIAKNGTSHLNTICLSDLDIDSNNQKDYGWDTNQ